MSAIGGPLGGAANASEKFVLLARKCKQNVCARSKNECVMLHRKILRNVTSDAHIDPFLVNQRAQKQTVAHYS